MSAPKFDVAMFHRRVAQLYADWKENRDEKDLWNGADVIAIIYGNTDETRIYRKSSIYHLWLFGYELPDTLVLACEKSLVIYTSARKIKLLESLESKAPAGSIPITFIERSKKADINEETLKTMLKTIEESYDGTKIGILKKDKQEGASVDQWNKATEGLSTVDISKGISQLFSIKDATEQKYMKRAATASSSFLERVLIKKIEDIIDKEKKMSHADLSDEIEKLILSGKVIKEKVDRCYAPIIQSGGSYDLKPNASSSDSTMTFDTIICSLGIRYRNYCSNIARTLLIDPTPKQEKYADFLLDLQKVCLAAITPGKPISSVYEAAVAYIAEKYPELSEKFIGLEYREGSYLISSRCKREIKEGMAFNLILGFQDIPLSVTGKPDNYAILLSDIVLVSENETSLLTVLSEKKFTYKLEDDEEEDSTLPADSALIEEIVNSTSTRKVRAAAVDTKIMEEETRRAHQDNLQRKQNEERIRKYAAQKAGNTETETPVIQTDLQAYKSAAEFPNTTQLHRIRVDAENEAIILPIYGSMVPFHISTIKNVTKDADYLRINFLYPGTAANMSHLNHKALASAKKVSFIRELSFCIPDQNAITSYVHQIKQLLKLVKQREDMKNRIGSIKKQEPLKLTKGVVPRLSQVFPRPSASGKSAGILEAHRNGLRFFCSKKSKKPIDVLYKNIRHAFFQPCDAREMIAALHLHLYDSILVGKKTTKDVQFCMEVAELSQSLSKTSRYGDPDEFEEERRERKMRKRTNDTFHEFAKKVTAQVHNMFEFDIPYKQLGFYGVPFKSLVFVQPTVNCLVQLIEPPFFVLTIQDIEICSLERVSFRLQQFDAIFVMKDLTQKVVRLDNIPMESLEGLKKWLDQCNIAYYESPENLMWNRIMKVINEDPVAFFKQGGWQDMLAPVVTEVVEEIDDDDDFSEEDFGEPDEEDSLELISEESGSFEDEDDEDEMDDASEAPDWDDLEEECLKQDIKKKQKRRERGEGFSDDEEPARKRRR